MINDLENRFLRFALKVRDFCSRLKKDSVNTEYIKQLIRCSSSIGANYIEASDDLGKADERMKIKIAQGNQKKPFSF